MQISTKIEYQSTLEKETTTQNYQKSFKQQSKQKSNIEISDFQIEKLEYDDGLYFVAISYENIPSIDKFLKKAKTIGIQGEVNNSYLKNLNIQELNNTNYTLKRHNKKWYIKSGQAMSILDKRDFERFFKSIVNDTITIALSSSRGFLYDGDEFYFNISSKKDGYVTVLTVYEDGTVSVLLPNIPIKKNQTIKAPSSEYGAVPVAGLVEERRETFDLYVGLYSQKRSVLDKFAMADSSYITQERYKNFDELIKFLDNKVFATLKVVTKPR